MYFIDPVLSGNNFIFSKLKIRILAIPGMFQFCVRAMLVLEK